MKQMKLICHQKSFSDDSLIIGAKDFPGLQIGDIVEIYLPDDTFSRLLLQVTILKEDFQKDAISVEQSLANAFQLRVYADVIVNKVDPRDVALDSVELVFKDHYLARSDMWRWKQAMINTCVYTKKLIKIHSSMLQVYEMWAHGEQVASGVITADTKIVYRSASSMVYLFIQMSSEMWDFDTNGDLYFEKAVNGFLCDLIAKWKDMKCNHDINIVLFSRVFYETKSKEQFPEHMAHCVQVDYKGRFYEDFYRVAVQNERIDDWTQTLRLLKTYFNEYPKQILEHHHRPNVRVPTAVNSTASQGNFLQVLNMSLNVFEKHFMDRSFDRTGQLSVVITPGVGVFEVDRDLTNITKQRIIDNGIGSDLVCLGEQPLHAVPLFKFQSKHPTGLDMKDDYNMPHWINLSFYSTTPAQFYSKFVPRIKLPTPQPKPSHVKALGTGMYACRSQPPIRASDSISVVYDYDEYDANIFKGCSPSQSGPKMSTLQRANMRRRSHLPTPPRPLNQEDDTSSSPTYSSGSSHSRSGAISIPRRGASCYARSQASSTLGSDGTAVAVCDVEKPRVLASKENLEFVVSPPHRTVVGSAGQVPEALQERQKMPQQPRALINPFDPSQVTIKLTSNRRRWTHVFPLGPTGIFMQQHHYQAIPHSSSRMMIQNQELSTHLEKPAMDVPNKKAAKDVHMRPRVVFPSSLGNETPIAKTGHSWLWGTTGEQEWTPALTTGVDWKSLVIPACLPITTDFFPDKHSLQYDYVVSDYSLLPEEHNSEINQIRCYRGEEDYKHHKPLTTLQVYQELICQRLQQGFQIITLPKSQNTVNGTQHSSGHSVLRGHAPVNEEKEECRMSIGRIFHTIALNGPVITVTQYRPRHASREVQPIQYVYNFQPPGSTLYDISRVIFSSEKLETFNWSYLDHYICIRGEREYGLKEALKYWRLRMLLLPGSQAATRKIIDSKDTKCRCDIYPDFTATDEAIQREAFVKFLEIMNRIRWPANTRRSKSVGAWVRSSSNPMRLSISHQGSPLTTSPQSGPVSAIAAGAFRDRVSSNRIHDRPRSLHTEHLRADVMPAGRMTPAADSDSKKDGSNSSLEATPESVAGESSDEKLNAEVKCLTVVTPPGEIVEAMKNPSDGICILPKQGGIPQNSFISVEATTWVRDHVEGVHSDQDAIQLLQKLVEETYICHASGDVRHPFVNGFYIYYFPEKNAKENYEVDLEAYQHEWMEVELLPQDEHTRSAGELESTEIDIGKRLQFRNVNVDIDVGGRSDRPEWGQAQYHTIFQPGEAFEIIVEWMVATGYIIADLVLGWARKANSQGLQLVPIPSDPFVLPESPKSDPLRGAIFVPLQIGVLDNPASQLLRGGGLEQFQEYVAHRFGFITLRDLQSTVEHRTYVHTTGGMFLMIPRTSSHSREPSPPEEADKTLGYICCEADVMEHCLKHCEEPPAPYTNRKVGFLWSYNYMITKRWKNTATIDEQFMRGVMQDFRALCSNQEGRLVEAFEAWLCTWCAGTMQGNQAAELFPQIEQ
ncbi:GATOR complex protein Iml1 isoform X4 [Rhipicephalus microplus]|uniref:GATOR complex protein Iml1 isoform X4 n=1 Tax=Rhipicephalus microplus TaxID=6941 RepID=UPI003F6AB33D